MWPMMSRSKQVSRGALRNRKSIKPSVDSLEERRLLSFSPISYSIFPQATVSVAGKEYSNGKSIDRKAELPLSMDGYANTESPAHPSGTSATASALMFATASTTSQGKVQSGTVTVSKDDLNVVIRNSTASSRAQTNFTYNFKSDSNFIFRASGSFTWKWGVIRTQPGSLGNIAIYKGTTLVKKTDLTVYAGTPSPFAVMSEPLKPGDYTIKLECANNTNIYNTSTLTGNVDWSVTTV